MRQRLGWAGVSLLIGVTLAWQHPVHAEPVFGQWSLDAQHSDNAREILAGIYTQEREEQAKKAPPDAPELPDWRLPLPLMDATALSIRMQNGQVQLTPDQGDVVEVIPNGEVPPVSLSNWGSQRQNAVRFGLWEKDTLVMESSLDSGTRVVQSYYLNMEGMLVQDTRINRPRTEPIVIKRLFTSNGKAPVLDKP